MRFDRSLVILKNYLGDTVMAAPLVRAVAANSDAVDILGSSTVEQLLRYQDLRARFYDPGDLANVLQLFRMARKLREGRYEAAFIVNRSFRSALLAKLARIPLRIGHDTEGRGWLLNRKIQYRTEENEAQCYLDLARPFLDQLPTNQTPFLEVTDKERSEGRELVDGATVGVQLGARHDYKQVPASVWKEVLAHLAGRGVKVAFFGGPEERPLIEQIDAKGQDLVGRTSLRQSLGALSNLDLMLGADTGVMHLAAAVGTPTVTCFGPTAAQKWGWFQPPHQVIQAKDGNLSNLESAELISAVEQVLCA